MTAPVRMSHPESPDHEIAVAEGAVERYASQGWDRIAEPAPSDDVEPDADNTPS